MSKKMRRFEFEITLAELREQSGIRLQASLPAGLEIILNQLIRHAGEDRGKSQFDGREPSFL
jgi:hypothetical protein